jgi:hypothetical protein
MNMNMNMNIYKVREDVQKKFYKLIYINMYNTLSVKGTWTCACWCTSTCTWTWTKQFGGLLIVTFIGRLLKKIVGSSTTVLETF